MRSAHEGATPLLLAHTYPGSSVDYLDVIDRLVDPVEHGGRAEDAFDVVIPDAPGYGFSQPLASPGWTVGKVAEAYDRLMRGLGYDSYGIHGSDNGAMVARELDIADVHEASSLDAGQRQLERLEKGIEDALANRGVDQALRQRG